MDEFSNWLTKSTQENFYDSNKILYFRFKLLGKEDEKNILELYRNFSYIKGIDKIFKQVLNFEPESGNFYYEWLKEKISFFYIPFVEPRKFSVDDNLEVSKILMDKFLKLDDVEKISYYLFIEYNLDILMNQKPDTKIIETMFRNLNFSSIKAEHHFYTIVRYSSKISQNMRIIMEKLLENYVDGFLIKTEADLNNLEKIIYMKKINGIPNRFKSEFFHLCTDRHTQNIVTNILQRIIKKFE
jgi:hypothetical protein